MYTQTTWLIGMLALCGTRALAMQGPSTRAANPLNEELPFRNAPTPLEVEKQRLRDTKTSMKAAKQGGGTREFYRKFDGIRDKREARLSPDLKRAIEGQDDYASKQYGKYWNEHHPDEPEDMAGHHPAKSSKERSQKARDRRSSRRPTHYGGEAHVVY